jgi:hypothetical protein
MNTQEFDEFECEVCDNAFCVPKDHWINVNCPVCATEYRFDVDDFPEFSYSRKVICLETINEVI